MMTPDTNDKVKKILSFAGLETIQIEAYILLANNGPMTAYEAHKRLQKDAKKERKPIMTFNPFHDRMKDLEIKKFIKCLCYKPAPGGKRPLYDAIELTVCLSEVMKIIEENIPQAFDMIFEQREIKNRDEFNSDIRIYTKERDAIINAERTIEKDCNLELCISARSLRWMDDSSIKSILKTKKQDRVRIRILYSDGTRNNILWLKNNAFRIRKVKKGPLQTYCIIDGKKLILGFSSHRNKKQTLTVSGYGVVEEFKKKFETDWEVSKGVVR